MSFIKLPISFFTSEHVHYPSKTALDASAHIWLQNTLAEDGLRGSSDARLEWFEVETGRLDKLIGFFSIQCEKVSLGKRKLPSSSFEEQRDG